MPRDSSGGHKRRPRAERQQIDDLLFDLDWQVERLVGATRAVERLFEDANETSLGPAPVDIAALLNLFSDRAEHINDLVKSISEGRR